MPFFFVLYQYITNPSLMTEKESICVKNTVLIDSNFFFMYLKRVKGNQYLVRNTLRNTNEQITIATNNFQQCHTWPACISSSNQVTQSSPNTSHSEINQ